MSPSRTRGLRFVLALLVVASTMATPAVAAVADGASTSAAATPPTPLASAADPTHITHLTHTTHLTHATHTTHTTHTTAPADSTDPTPLASRHEPEIRERQTFARGDTPGTVRLHLRYDIPTGVTAFRVRLADLAGPSVAVVDTDGFDRQGETALAWTRSTSTPTVTLELRVATDEVSAGEWGIERDGWAFATVPPMGIDVTYAGTRPGLTSTTQVGGEGYATDRMAFMGAYDTVDVRGQTETVQFVLGNGTAAANVSAARSFLDRATGRFDFGVRRDRLVVFVLPYEGRAAGEEAIVTGEAFGDAFWVTADATAVTGAENAFAHEYVHSRLAAVGNGSAAWLTEATAEYYGSLSVLNVGGTSYEQFYRTTRTTRFAPDETAIVLADPETWRGTLGNYEKGAHVLAALDAEIRNRTDLTLYDVFLAHQTFDDYAAFRAAVVETTGAEALGPWLDRYVTTEALPPLPDDPAWYVHGPDLDPDGDGLTSRAELSGSPPTNPFVADTDGDTLSDAREREAETDPTSADTDGDGTNDALDAYPTDPTAQRTDATEEGATVTPTATTASPTAQQGQDESGATTGTSTETPGFGVGTAVAAGVAGGILRGMRCRRENRSSS